MNEPICLDHNAAPPVRPEVSDAMLPRSRPSLASAQVSNTRWPC